MVTLCRCAQVSRVRTFLLAGGCSWFVGLSRLSPPALPGIWDPGDLYREALCTGCFNYCCLVSHTKGGDARNFWWPLKSKLEHHFKGTQGPEQTEREAADFDRALPATWALYRRPTLNFSCDVWMSLKLPCFFVESKDILIYKDTCTVNKHLLSYLDLADTSVEGKRSVLFTLFFSLSIS